MARAVWGQCYPITKNVGVDEHERAEKAGRVMISIETVSKPSNAGWVAKAEVNPDGHVRVAPAEASPEHQFHTVNIAWYGDDRVKVTLIGGGPALIRQAYLSGAGQDVILDLVAAPPKE